MKLKALGLALVGSAVAVALVGGATFALFTATTGNSANNFTAGKMCLSSKRNNSDWVPGPMFYVTGLQGSNGTHDGKYPTGYWVPGDMNSRNLNVTNGDAADCVELWLTTVQATIEDSGDPQHPSDPTLADKLMVTIKALNPTHAGEWDVVVANQPLSNFFSSQGALLQWPTAVNGSKYLDLVPGATQDLEFDVTFDSSAGNADQGKNLKVTFKVNAEQYDNNPHPVALP